MVRKKENRKYQAGMTLIEAVMAMGLLAFVLVGSSSLIISMSQSQRNVATKAALAAIKKQFISYIQGGTSWKNTVLGSTSPYVNHNLSCLSTNTPCTPMVLQPIDAIYDANSTTAPNGLVFYGNVGGSSTTTGFTMAGTTCTLQTSYFNPVVGGNGGNDNCPFRYDLSVTLACPKSATITASTQCLEPIVTVYANLEYAPLTKGNIVVNKTMPEINVQDYSVTVTRAPAADGLNQFLYVAQIDSGTNGGGSCAATGSYRFYTTGISTAVDLASSTKGYVTTAESSPPSVVQGNILDILAANGSGYALELAAGGYVCDVMAEAWAVNSWTLAVSYVPVAGGSAVPVGSKTGYARQANAWAQQQLTIEKMFLNLSTNSYLQVLQSCSTTPTAGGMPNDFTTSSDNYAMGLPSNLVGVGGGTIGVAGSTDTYSSISCTRVY